MSIEKRIERLENQHPRRRRIEELTSNELAELITGVKGTKADDLSIEYLQAVVNGSAPFSAMPDAPE